MKFKLIINCKFKMFGIQNNNNLGTLEKAIPPNKDIIPTFTKGKNQILRVTSML